MNEDTEHGGSTSYGVVIIVDKEVRKSVLKFISTSERAMTLHISCDGGIINLI